MYKYCIVPKCINTSIETPEKLFFNVPKDTNLRKKWYSVVKRDDKTPPSTQATRHCCEDHFDLEEDMENYVKFKLVGGRLKLKKGVLPHKFECQKHQEKKIDRMGFKKRQDIEYFERVLSKDIGHEDLLLHSIEVVECENQDLNIILNSDPLNIPQEIDVLPENNERGKTTQAVQVNIKPKMKTKSNNTPAKWKQQMVKNIANPINLDPDDSFSISNSNSSIITCSSSFNASDNESNSDLGITNTLNKKYSMNLCKRRFNGFISKAKVTDRHSCPFIFLHSTFTRLHGNITYSNTSDFTKNTLA
ncbi:hypothetical protein evm_004399 [Chilo suppressalis]|nr:hypothetical protein evm_004399 [Chilo suppressalis]